MIFNRHFAGSQLSKEEQQKYIDLATGPVRETYMKQGYILETDLDMHNIPETDEQKENRYTK